MIRKLNISENEFLNHVKSFILIANFVHQTPEGMDYRKLT